MISVGTRLNRGLFSSVRGDWATPQQLIQALRTEFPFTLDACAAPDTAVADEWFSSANESIGPAVWSGVVWVNPPYGRGVDAWIVKAIQEAERGATVVMLLPARTDTAWFHELVIPHAAEIRFLRGRLSFDDGKGRAPFPSMLLVFRPAESFEVTK